MNCSLSLSPHSQTSCRLKMKTESSYGAESHLSTLAEYVRGSSSSCRVSICLAGTLRQRHLAGTSSQISTRRDGSGMLNMRLICSSQRTLHTVIRLPRKSSTATLNANSFHLKHGNMPQTRQRLPYQSTTTNFVSSSTSASTAACQEFSQDDW